MEKKSLSERDICTKCVTPAILDAGWLQSQFREEVKLTDGRVMVRGQLAARVVNPDAKGGPKRADYVLYARPNIPIAVIEVKRNIFAVGHGMIKNFHPLLPPAYERMHLRMYGQGFSKNLRLI